MRSTTPQLLALAMVGMMLLSGCAGWGTDGPADDGDSENDTGDDLADEQNQSQNQSDDSSDSGSDSSDSSSESGSDTSTGDSSTDADSSSSDSDRNSSSSDSATDSSDDSSESSDCPTDDCPDQSDDTDGTTDGSSDTSPQGSDPADDGSTGDASGDDSSDSGDSSDGDSSDDTNESDGSDGADGDTNESDGDSGDGDGDEQLTCDAFDTQPEAQMYYDEAPGERGHLDADNDDLPCEHLPDGDPADPNETDSDTATGVVTVVDQNGDPVEGEPVTLWPPGAVDEEATETRETNEDGKVVIELSAGDPSDAVMFDVVVRGEEKTLGIMSDEQAGVQKATFEVDTSENGTSEPETHSLNVTVTGPNEDPVENASVSVVTYDGGEDVASGTTNSEGVATFDVLNGEYEVTVTKADSDLHQPSDQRLVNVSGQDASLDVQMEDSGDNGGTGEETHTVTFLADSPVTLTAAASGEAIGTKEPTDGAVTFEGLPAGEYTFDAEGYYNGLIFVDSDAELELQDTDGAEMNITVTDAQSGERVEGAEISGVCDLWYTGGDSYVETTSASGSDGIVTVRTGVTPTTCDATVTADGYEDKGVVLNAPDDDGRTVELQPVETATPDPNETGDMNETNGNATAALA